MADAASATGLGSVTPKPPASFLEEYERQLALKKQQGAMAPDAFQQNYKSAAERLAGIAAGTPSTAVQAAQQASREALARQAGNVRAATAQNIAASGQLGQGAGARAAQATETGIMKSMADSRLAERQAIGQEAMDANRDIITNAQAEQNFKAKQDAQSASNLQNLLQFGTAAQKLEAQVGLQQLAGITPSAKSDEINERAYQEAITDPKYLADIAVAKETQGKAEGQLAATSATKSTGGRELNLVPEKNTDQKTYSLSTGTNVGDAVSVDGRALIFNGEKVGSIMNAGTLVNTTYYEFTDPSTGEVIKRIKYGAPMRKA